MRHLWVLAVLLAGCGPIDERKEAWADYYGAPAGETETKVVERKEIEHWSKDLKSSQRLGYLEKCTQRLKGTREWHDLYYIKDAGGMSIVGFINENGVFYRYDRQARPIRVGEYPIAQGLKVFFGLPLSSTVVLAAIDPYKG